LSEAKVNQTDLEHKDKTHLSAPSWCFIPSGRFGAAFSRRRKTRRAELGGLVGARRLLDREHVPAPLAIEIAWVHFFPRFERPKTEAPAIGWLFINIGCPVVLNCDLSGL
tara:strand:+ start:398 stop:727 length:330 start_codon:yes stop_codon:yes gene_type:complete